MNAIVAGKVEKPEGRFIATDVYELTFNKTTFSFTSGANAIKIVSKFFPEFYTIIRFDLSQVDVARGYLTVGSAEIKTSNLYSSTNVYVPVTYYTSDNSLHINPSYSGSTVSSNTYISKIEIGTLE